MRAVRAAFIHSTEIERYRYPPQHPFKTQRAALTKNVLVSLGLYEGEGWGQVGMNPISDEQLRLFHTPAYLEALARASKGAWRPNDLFMGLGTEDCPYFPDLYPYTLLAAGATIKGAELILAGSTDVAFNPSGGFHHAHADRAEAFCYVNDVVLACLLLSQGGRRVFCLDLDAHHGNGTQEAFYGDPSVFTVSFHENGRTLFPGGGFEHEIGEGAGRGYNVNVPLPAGSDDDVFNEAFRAVVPPLIAAYRPDCIVLETGMDVLSTDPLTHLKMTNHAFADALPAVRDYGAPILALGGGGYDVEGTARGWALVWAVLCGIEPEEDLTAGMGGVFLGTSEWNPGLRDRHVYAQGEEKQQLLAEVRDTVEKIRRTVFPLHGLPERG